MLLYGDLTSPPNWATLGEMIGNPGINALVVGRRLLGQEAQAMGKDPPAEAAKQQGAALVGIAEQLGRELKLRPRSSRRERT